MTRHPRRVAAVLLLAGALLAVATPAYLASASPSLAGYLLHWSLFLIQLIPFALCAALWLPRRSRAAATVALIMSGVMLVTAIIIYMPMLWVTGSRGGDMIALTFLATSAATIVVLLAGSVVGALIVRKKLRDREGAGCGTHNSQLKTQN